MLAAAHVDYHPPPEPTPPTPALQGKAGPTALRLYEEMLGLGVKPDKTLLSSLFKALGASGMVEDCMRIFRKIVRGPSRCAVAGELHFCVGGVGGWVVWVARGGL